MRRRVADMQPCRHGRYGAPMWTPLLLLAVTSQSDASELFHPDASDRMVPLPEGTTLTGTVLAYAEDPLALESDPEVQRVVVLKGSGRVVRVEPRAGVSPIVLSNRLHARSDVRWAHPDLFITWVEHARPDDPYLDQQWHLINEGQRGFVPGVDINAEEAWDVTDGAGTLIAVIDSGVDIDHPDIRVIDGPDFIDGDASSDPQDGNNHGTAVAGLAAGTGNNGVGTAGVAYGAEVYGLRLINGTSTLESTYNTFVDAVDAGADVINNSWGVETGCSGFPRLSAIEAGYDYAEENGREGLGTVIVFAAGNDACDVRPNGLLFHPSVIAVAAISGDDTRENYSNFGPWVDIGAPSGRIVTADLVGAEGGGNVDGDPDYTSNFGGTSAAAPQVAGVAALMMAANPRLLASQIRTVLCDTSVQNHLDSGQWDETGFNPLYGCGRIDAGAAVRAVANQGPPLPPEIEAEAETLIDRVLLTWEPSVDPDGDADLRYRVRWAYADEPKNERTAVVDRPWLDLTDRVREGDVILWRVRGIDVWGPGDFSETGSLAIVAPEPEPEPEPQGCGHSPASGAWLWWVPGLLWWGRKRRS